MTADQWSVWTCICVITWNTPPFTLVLWVSFFFSSQCLFMLFFFLSFQLEPFSVLHLHSQNSFLYFFRNFILFFSFPLVKVYCKFLSLSDSRSKCCELKFCEEMFVLSSINHQTVRINRCNARASSSAHHPILHDFNHQTLFTPRLNSSHTERGRMHVFF